MLVLWLFCTHIKPVVTVGIWNYSAEEAGRDWQGPGSANVVKQQLPGSVRDTVSRYKGRMIE